MRIDMNRYVRLGQERQVFDSWLYEVGLLPGNHVTGITFGEGVHHLDGYEVEPGANGTSKIATTVAIVNGEMERVAVIREWDWAGPLPPASVMERLREIEREGLE